MFWKKKNREKNSFVCQVCGKTHTEWPAITFKTPDPYFHLSELEQNTIAYCSEDFCEIKYPNQTDRFIRVVLKQKIIDHSFSLDYGVWVSLSERSFNDYKNNFHNPKHEATYFGRLCNTIFEYENTYGVQVNVETKSGGNDRPEIIPHREFVHPFVYDYYHGITIEEAEKRVKVLFD